MSVKVVDIYLAAAARQISTTIHLRKRKDIVVKAADKGGALVVWWADLYQKEALRQLSDTSFDKDLTSTN